MIPERLYGPLPPGHPWLVIKHPRSGRLIVVLSEAIPRHLEQAAVKMALRQWRQKHRPGLAVIPGGLLAGHHWLTRHAVAGAAAVVTAAAITGYALTTPPHRIHTRPPVATAPTPAPSRPQPIPGRPGRTSHAGPRARAVVTPVALRASTPPPAARVRVPVAPVTVPPAPRVWRPVPPVRVVRPPVVVPPVSRRPVPVYLVDVRVGKLMDVRVGHLVHVRI